MYLLGFDIGSSSVKAALVEVAGGQVLRTGQYPEREMEIHAPQPGWAEQEPASWWHAVALLSRKLLQEAGVAADAVQAIGLSYQMHGLVMVDANLCSLRPAIIWCDSRAVATGEASFGRIGPPEALRRLLNSPGNFTAAKLRWVREHEPDTYRKARHFMLPGDYVAMCMTGQPATTIPGLSEGVLWDFLDKAPARCVLEDLDIAPALVPPLVPTFGPQGALTASAAVEMGLRPGTPVTYRAGDQPNNALSLNVLEPGEVAATGGTSGVVYAVTDRPIFDPLSRVNGFAHVNYTPEDPRIGVLMCINGAGITYSWLRQQMGRADTSYFDLEKCAAEAPVGADGLSLLPFGNGAERIFQNRDMGAHLLGLRFNGHGPAHLLRAGLEGMAFAFVYGMGILKSMGLHTQVIRVGDDNLFQSRIFSEAISTLSGSHIEVLHTTGAVGAAKAAGFGAGLYGSLREAIGQAAQVGVFEPLPDDGPHREAYARWAERLAGVRSEG